MSRNPAKDEVAIIGIGRSPYARDRNVSELTLVTEAATDAIRDSALVAADIDGLVGGGLHTGGIDPSVVASALGLKELTWTASVRPPIGNHLLAAVNAVWAGSCESALVYHSCYRMGSGAFRERAGLGLADGRAILGDGHTDFEPWGLFGSTGYAAWAGRYLNTYSRTREDLGLIAINDRVNAAANPEAALRAPLTMQDYLAGRMIREPLCVFDMDLPIDGADAFVVTSAERARDLPVRPVLVHAAALGMTGTPQEHLTPDFQSTGQSVVARALKERSDLWIDDIDVFLPYDGFSIIALRCFEAYGFCKDGEAGEFLTEHWDAEQNRILIDGNVPVNPHGGSLSEGGSQGAGHLREAVRQLRGTAGDRQVEGASSALLTPGGFFFNSQGFVLRTDSTSTSPLGTHHHPKGRS